MDLRKILLIVTLAVSTAAHSTTVTEVEAVETVTSNISVPTSTNGRLMFRPCAADCDEKFIAVRLTTDTQYFVREQRVDFLEFRKQFFNIRRSSDDYALVSYDTKSKTVTSIYIGL